MSTTFPLTIGPFCPGGYTVQETESGIFVSGHSIPIDDLVAIGKRAKKRGFKIMDTGAAVALGCIAVITSPKGSAEIRAELDARNAHLPPLARWRSGWDVGVSSCAIAHAIGGTRLMGGHEPPSDPDDFGRCIRLVRLMEWEQELPRVSAHWPEWSGIVGAWQELAALYDEEWPTGKCPRLYARMEEVR